MIIPVIMCGGAGTRLWPASRESLPKQFIPLFGTLSTFQETLSRVNEPAMFAPPIVITNSDFRSVVLEQARALNMSIDVVLEPVRRDSGPAVTAAAKLAMRQDPKATVLVLAADHFIPEVKKFRADCQAAQAAVSSGYVVTFGIKPSEPSTSYGYVEPGDDLGLGGVCKLNAFVEKPDLEKAMMYCQRGYLWNSGNFFFPAHVMCSEIERLLPPMSEAVEAAIAEGRREEGVLELNAASFRKAPKISIDYAVMEKTDKAAVLPATFVWSDIGSWDAVWKLSDKDTEGNVVSGNAFVESSKNVLIRSDDNVLTAVIGLENIVVVATKDAVMVTSHDKAQHVKGVVDALKKKGHEEVTR